MITAGKIHPDFVSYCLVLAMVFVLAGRTGRQAMEWILMKLYELFIQRNPVKL